MRRILLFALGLSVAARGVQFVGNVIISNFYGPDFFRIWQTVWNSVVAGQQFAPIGINLLIARGEGPKSRVGALLLLGMIVACLGGLVVMIAQPEWLLITSRQQYIYSGAAWLLMSACAFFYAVSLRHGNYNRYSIAANLAPILFVVILPLAYFLGWSPHELMLAYSAVSILCAWIAVGNCPWPWQFIGSLGEVGAAARSVPKGIALMLPNAIFSLQVALLLVATADRSPEANLAFAYLVPIINVHSIVPNAISNILMTYRAVARRGASEMAVATSIFGCAMYFGGADVLFYLMGFKPPVSDLYLGLAIIGSVAMVITRLLISTLMAEGEVGRANAVAGTSAITLALALYLNASDVAATLAYCAANCAGLVAAMVAFLGPKDRTLKNPMQAGHSRGNE